MGMDATSKWVYKTKIVEKENFAHETIKNFIKSIMDKTKITTIITDGSNRYPSITEKLRLKHKLFNFHKMQNYIDKIKTKYNGLKRKKKNRECKLEENLKELDELEKQRKGKSVKEER